MKQIRKNNPERRLLSEYSAITHRLENDENIGWDTELSPHAQTCTENKTPELTLLSATH